MRRRKRTVRDLYYETVEQELKRVKAENEDLQKRNDMLAYNNKWFNDYLDMRANQQGSNYWSKWEIPR